MRRDASTLHRAALLTGTVAGLAPVAFYLALLLILGA